MEIPEYTFTEGTISIEINAVGGGTVGESYAQNNWEYEISDYNEVIVSGSDMRSGLPETHEGMAATLLTFMAAEAEHYEHVYMRHQHSDDEYLWSEDVGLWAYVNAEELYSIRESIYPTDPGDW